MVEAVDSVLAILSGTGIPSNGYLIFDIKYQILVFDILVTLWAFCFVSFVENKIYSFSKYLLNTMVCKIPCRVLR